VIATKGGNVTKNRLMEIAPQNVRDALEEKRQEDRMWLVELDETGGTATVTMRLMAPTPEHLEAMKNGFPKDAIPCFRPTDDERHQLTFTVEP
jgi:hypothetical protein